MINSRAAHLRLLGVTRPDALPRIVGPKGALAKVETQVVEALGLAAILVREERGHALKQWMMARTGGNRARLEGMLAMQRNLEAVSAVAPVVPAAFGGEPVDPREVLGLLAANAQMLSRALDTYGPLVQFQIIVHWDAPRMLRHLADQGSLVEAKQLGQGGNSLAMGRMIQQIMEQRRTEMATGFLAVIGDAAIETLRLPASEDTIVLNAVALIERAQEAALDAAVRSVDDAWPGFLTIKYLGPMPAVSFASIAVTRPDPQALLRARLLFGVDDHVNEDDLKGAYHRFMKLNHPDQNAGADTPDVAEAEGAYRLLRRVAASARAMPAATSGTGAPLLLDLRREGDLPWAA